LQPYFSIPAPDNGQKKFNSRSVAPSLEYLFGSRTVSFNPPRHSGVSFRRDF